MRLSELVQGVGTLLRGHGDLEAFHITHDSRRAQPGCVFVALEGDQFDGHHYIECALQQGCVAIVTSRPDKVKSDVPILQVEHPRRAMAELARRLYGQPDEQLCTIGVTGTNGKTTTTFLLQQLLLPRGQCGRLGTLTYFNGVSEERATRTTPESPMLYRSLAEMVENGCRYVAMEISSHALVLDRIHQLKLNYALFTNLSQDHLDFHGDMEQYFQAKMRIFEHLQPGGQALINGDDAFGRRLLKMDGFQVLSFGRSPDCDLRFEVLGLSPQGSHIRLHFKSDVSEFHLPLLGLHNVYNFAGALLVALGEGLSFADVARLVPNLKPVAGRMEPVNLGQPFGVAVDFAHSPDALEKIAQCCHEMKPKRLIFLFGAGGDRDRAKRPKMGAVVDRFADVIFLTSDNPRSEDPERILDDIQQGIQRPVGSTLVRLSDRRAAIQQALDLAQPGDLVLLAGKGHETTQEIKGIHYPFNDREEAITVLKKKGY
ncbi:MAG: UDP-N-acetylmuramoyl-L-alanyl-D-glutamate--2,6-diaminopimelate ligase [Acidobacteria bacterium]|nr:UDP-N-acetylmuramoyl-L-alanyl-D-glutamate--2,6-diaminopimelate ligase [Acidobacteriota bacterium]MCB9396568.1 UDP-N-acetylmuramoyl-L-alanyl-D-glutamate--2,6-diaminopimelate ligase [Acidobacteriota bacterium]